MKPDAERQVEVLLEATRFRVLRRTERTADGQVVVRDSVDHPGAVVILPLPGDDRVCLIRNRRPAVGETLVELPAGTLEPGEDPQRAAARELTEETGYTAARIEPLCELWMSPGILKERTYLYVATGLTAGRQRLEAGEEIETLIVPWSEAMAMIETGKIVDSKTVSGLLYYERFRRRGASAESSRDAGA